MTGTRRHGPAAMVARPGEREKLNGLAGPRQRPTHRIKKRSGIMDRRTLMKGLAATGAMAATGKLAAPAIAQGAKALKFVPQANLANFDPVWGTQYVVRNASQLVWDTLYGLDSKLQPQRQ